MCVSYHLEPVTKNDVHISYPQTSVLTNKACYLGEEQTLWRACVCLCYCKQEFFGGQIF